MQDHYTFLGLNLAVLSDDPQVSFGVRSRLRHFRTNGHVSPDLLVEFYCVAPDGDRAAPERLRGARPVYEHSVGEIVYSDLEDRFYINYADRVRVSCEPGRGHAQVAILEPVKDNFWLITHPMFTLPLIELLKRRGRYSLHAAGFCVEGRGLLFPGTSGAGKSTLALALLRAGFGFLGDDTLFLSSGQDGLRVMAFPDEIDVTDQTTGFFPELRGQLSLPGEAGRPKRQILAEEVYGAGFVAECRPAVLVFPRPTGAARSILEPMGRAEALLELTPNVLLTEARSSQAHLDALAELARTCDCYRLDTGRDFDTLPKLLGRLVAEPR